MHQKLYEAAKIKVAQDAEDARQARKVKPGVTGMNQESIHFLIQERFMRRAQEEGERLAREEWRQNQAEPAQSPMAAQDVAQPLAPMGAAPSAAHAPNLQTPPSQAATVPQQEASAAGASVPEKGMAFKRPFSLFGDDENAIENAAREDAWRIFQAEMEAEAADDTPPGYNKILWKASKEAAEKKRKEKRAATDEWLKTYFEQRQAATENGTGNAPEKSVRKPLGPVTQARMSYRQDLTGQAFRFGMPENAQMQTLPFIPPEQENGVLPQKTALHGAPSSIYPLRATLASSHMPRLSVPNVAGMLPAGAGTVTDAMHNTLNRPLILEKSLRNSLPAGEPTTDQSTEGFFTAPLKDNSETLLEQTAPAKDSQGAAANPLTAADIKAGIVHTEVNGTQYIDYTAPINARLEQALPEFWEHAVSLAANGETPTTFQLLQAVRSDEVIANLMWFVEQVKPNALWDPKEDDSWKRLMGTDITMIPQGDRFVYEGEIITREDMGNITFGYLGKALGLPDKVIYIGGGIAKQLGKEFGSYDSADQILKAAWGSVDKWTNADEHYGDDKKDHDKVETGINLYMQKYGQEGITH